MQICLLTTKTKLTIVKVMSENNSKFILIMTNFRSIMIHVVKQNKIIQ